MDGLMFSFPSARYNNGFTLCLVMARFDMSVAHGRSCAWFGWEVSGSQKLTLRPAGGCGHPHLNCRFEWCFVASCV